MSVNNDCEIYNGGLEKYRGNEKNVVIPDGVTSIGVDAFEYCTEIGCITLPDSVRSIGVSAFKNCRSLNCIVVNENNPNFTSVDGILYDKEVKKLIFVPRAIEDLSTIQDSITSIGDGAFWNYTSLGSLTLMGITSIGNYAFYGCNSLSSIIIPNGVTEIGHHAFFGCISLGKIIIPDSVTKIGKFAFIGCTDLSRISVCENNPNFTSVDGVLYDKDIKKLISVPNKIKDSINIPASVTSIEDCAFDGCSSLSSINVDENNQNFTSVDGILYDKEIKKLIVVPGGINGSVSISEGVKTIEDYAFDGCGSLGSIIIPASVSSIGKWVFRGCASLSSINVDENNSYFTSIDGILYDKEIKKLIFVPCGINGSVVIPEGVLSIGDEAFYHCDSCVSVVIPESVTSIGKWAFRNCFMLMRITIPSHLKDFFTDFDCDIIVK